MRLVSVSLRVCVGQGACQERSVLPKCHSHSYVYVTPASRFILGCLPLIRNASMYFRNASWGIRRRMTGFAQ